MLRSGRNESIALLASPALEAMLLAWDAIPPADLAADPTELKAEAVEPIPIIFMIPAPLSANEPTVEAMPPALSASPVAVEAILETVEPALFMASIGAEAILEMDFIGEVKGVIILPKKLLGAAGWGCAGGSAVAEGADGPGGGAVDDTVFGGAAGVDV